MKQMLEHLESRHLDISKYHSVTVTSDCVTFQLYNFGLKLVGYQVYNPNNHKKSAQPRDCKYYTYTTEGEYGVWGMDCFDSVKPTVYLCEGIFDACRLHKHGLNAIAVLGNNPKPLANQLGILSGPYHYVACVQGDSASKKLLSFTRGRGVLLPDAKDVGDLTEDEFKHYFL